MLDGTTVQLLTLQLLFYMCRPLDELDAVVINSRDTAAVAGSRAKG